MKYFDNNVILANEQVKVWIEEVKGKKIGMMKLYSTYFNYNIPL